MFFVQADARQLPFRTRGADLVFCSLALHHFAEGDAVRVMREMRRVGRLGIACVDLVRGRVAVVLHLAAHRRHHARPDDAP